MQAVRYRITTLSPLVLSSNTGDPNMISTMDYIPATALRGLFAGEYIKRKGLSNAHQDERFYRWFLKGEIKLTNAYICIEENGKEMRFYPLPLSVQSIKGRDWEAVDLLVVDEEPDKRTKPERGFGVFSDSTLKKASVKRNLNFHHARNRERGVSKEGIIFNYESIREGQSFEGFIIGDDENLREFLEVFKDGVYYIGRSRNSQYGKIKLDFIQDKHQEFRGEIEFIEELYGDITITLLSDTIVYNSYGYSTTDLEEFEKLIGCKIKKAFIRPSQQEGFVSVWRLKTPQEVCFRAGSCFVVELKEGDAERIRQLQISGIGARTHEGFGRFAINWQSENEYSIERERKERVLKKPGDCPDENVKVILRNLIKDFLKREIKSLAIKRAGDFARGKLPPKSLLARLREAAENNSLDSVIANLKRIAKQHLENCTDGNTTLYDFVSNFKQVVEQKIQKSLKKDIQALCEEIGYKPEDDLMEEFRKIYTSTFFSTLRLKAKREA